MSPTIQTRFVKVFCLHFQELTRTSLVLVMAAASPTMERCCATGASSIGGLLRTQRFHAAVSNQTRWTLSTKADCSVARWEEAGM